MEFELFFYCLWMYDSFVIGEFECAECLQHSWADSGYCRNHHPNPDFFSKKIIQDFLESPPVMTGRNWSGCDFSGLDLSKREFRYCRFSRSVFKAAQLNDTHFSMCFLDDIDATGTEFYKMKWVNVMAASGRFSGCNFSGCDLFNVNFNGIEGLGTRFLSSDLLYSRFVGASLEDAHFADCNIRQVDFTNAMLSGASFVDSNPEEAYILGKLF